MLEKRRVLVVEDEPALSGIITTMLEVFGFEGMIAENAEIAKKILQEEQFNFLILDLTLPDLPGLELYKEIIGIYSQYKGQVIFTSGFNASEELETIIENDGADFLPKPFTIEKFQKIVSKWN